MRIRRQSCNPAGLWVGVMCAVLLAPCASWAEIDHSGFELTDDCEWSGPWGGGMEGGGGKGEYVHRSARNFVRSGKRAVRLMVWDDGTTNAVGWAFLAQKLPCRPGSRVRAGANFFASSSVMPLPPGAVAQLRLEYYYDGSCESQIPTHVMLSEPFTLANGHRADEWQAVELQDRVPPNAQCMKLSILLMAEHPGGQPGAVWVDDTFLDVALVGARAARDAGSTPPPAPWWRRWIKARRP